MRAIIAYVTENMVDVIYEDGREESSISIERISNLQTFEMENCDSTPDGMKLNGNILFKLQDFSAATEWYLRGISLILDNNLSIGTRVIVCYHNILRSRIGIISDIDKRTNSVNVVYEDEESPEDEDNITVDRVTQLTSIEYIELQRALYMNLSKCATKLRRHGWAVKWSSLAVSVSGVLPAPRQSAEEEAYYLRGKCLLNGNRPSLASEDAKWLIDCSSSKGVSLQKEIDKFRTQRLKSNRKLAKDLAAWVEHAMAISESAKRSRILADVDLPDDV